MFTRPYISANFTKGNNFCDFLFASLGGGEILHKMGYPQELLFEDYFLLLSMLSVGPHWERREKINSSCSFK